LPESNKNPALKIFAAADAAAAATQLYVVAFFVAEIALE